MERAWQQIAKSSFWIGVIASMLCCMVAFVNEKDKSPAWVGGTLTMALSVGVAVCIASVPCVACVLAIGKILSFVFRSFGQRNSGEAYLARLIEKQQRENQYADERAKINAEANRRRQEARGRCEVLYATHSFEIAARFTREMFEAFMTKHLGDDKPPEYVEKLSLELCMVIQKHLDKTDGRAMKSVAELAQWFLKEKQQIENTTLGDDDKQMLIAQLEERYMKLQEKYLRSVQP